MSEYVFRTNLQCRACEDKVRRVFAQQEGIVRWTVDLESAERWLRIEGEGLTSERVRGWVAEAGFEAWEGLSISERPLVSLAASSTASQCGVKSSASSASTMSASTKSVSAAAASGVKKRNWVALYRPVWLLASYMLLTSLALEVAAGEWEWHRFMNHVMAGFFVGFSYFKLLDLPGFVRSFAGYDWLTHRWRGYGYVYPFVELGLGLGLAAGVWPVVMQVVTLVIMSSGLVGILAVRWRGESPPCACLGTAFQLPMSTVTIIENTSMIVMSGWMLWQMLWR